MTPEDIMRAEKGWIQHTDGGYTHNVILNEAKAHATAARMVRTTLPLTNYITLVHCISCCSCRMEYDADRAICDLTVY